MLYLSRLERYLSGEWKNMYTGLCYPGCSLKLCHLPNKKNTAQKNEVFD